MSMSFLRVVPTDPRWRANSERAEQAVSCLRRFAPDAQSVQYESHDGIEYIDAGGNWSGVRCPQCNADLDEWWFDEVEDAYEDTAFIDLTAILPCCARTFSLNEMTFAWPCGFASCELSAEDPNRDWLTTEELAEIAAVWGHPVWQTIARY